MANSSRSVPPHDLGGAERRPRLLAIDLHITFFDAPGAVPTLSVPPEPVVPEDFFNSVKSQQEELLWRGHWRPVVEQRGSEPRLGASLWLASRGGDSSMRGTREARPERQTGRLYHQVGGPLGRDAAAWTGGGLSRLTHSRCQNSQQTRARSNPRLLGDRGAGPVRLGYVRPSRFPRFGASFGSEVLKRTLATWMGPVAGCFDREVGVGRES